MTHTRRDFLRTSSLLATAAALPGFLAQSVRAAAGGGTKNLILFELEGGNDGLNTLVPFGMNGGSYYTEFRPTIGVAEELLLKLDTNVGLHPSLSELKTHYDAGRMAVIQGVSYPSPSFSHEVSAKVWGKGTVDPNVVEGWIARLLNLSAAPAFPCALDVSSAVSSVFQGANQFVPAFTSLSGFSFPYDGAYWSDKTNRRAAYEACVAASAVAADPRLATMGETAEGMLSLIDTVQALPSYTHVGSYPNHYASNHFKLVMTLLNANLGMNVFRVRLGGFDTHSDQNKDGYHAGRLALVSQGIQAMYEDIQNLGLGADTVFVVYSEFGRTVYENGSGGTDHGTVAPVFVIGDPVVGGLVSTHPSMDPAALDGHGEPAMTTDVRDVLATVAFRLFGANVAQVFPGHAFSDLGFLP